MTASDVLGNGTRYALAGSTTTAVSTVPLDQVAAMEAYREVPNDGKTFGVSLLATATGAVGTVFLLKAIFGSSPTVYSGDGEIEEAELFSGRELP